jgi:hypothetical protein
VKKIYFDISLPSFKQSRGVVREGLKQNQLKLFRIRYIKFQLVIHKFLAYNEYYGKYRGALKKLQKMKNNAKLNSSCIFSFSKEKLKNNKNK